MNLKALIKYYESMSEKEKKEILSGVLMIGLALLTGESKKG